MYSAHISERTDEILREIRQSRTVKIQKQCEKLAKYGFEISFPELCACAERIGIAPDCLNNGTIALFLLGTEANIRRAEAIAGRKIQTMTEMINTFLKENSEFPEIGYVKIDDYEIGIDEVIALAKHENALLSIAHPNFSFEKYGGLAGFEGAMREYRERGIEGIEYNALAPAEWEQLTRKLADEIDCILTFGSDYHGDRDDRHSGIGGIHPSLRETPELLEKNLGRFGERVFKIIE